MKKVTKYVLFDILQHRIVLGYAAFLLAVSLAMFNLDANPERGMVSLLNVVLIVVPLVSLVFSTIHFYNSYEFIELLLAQPLPRRGVLLSEFTGVALSLSAAFLLGVGVPVLLYSLTPTGITLLLTGLALTLVFTSLAFLAAVLTRDKSKGIGVALLLWFFFSLLYDGLVLLVLFGFSDYPLEKLVLALTALNPVDLGRILILLKMDYSALMGYTGALYRQFFGAGGGIALAAGVLALWVLLPMWGALRVFERKDL